MRRFLFSFLGRIAIRGNKAMRMQKQTNKDNILKRPRPPPPPKKRPNSCDERDENKKRGEGMHVFPQSVSHLLFFFSLMPSEFAEFAP